MIDTHAHIYAKEFDEDRAEIIARSMELGVRKIFMPNIDSESIAGMYQLVKDYPNHCYSMMGLHPCSVKEDYKEELKGIKKELDARDHIAVGEIGIDLYWDQSTKNIQVEAFVEQCTWAIERNLPVAIHSRESIDLLIKLIQSEFTNTLTGVFHCFTGSIEQAKAIMELGMYVGIGGVLTFKNSGLKEVMPAIPLDRIVLETDSPYLAPVPKRGKRNEPSYVHLVLQYLAELLNLDERDLDSQLEANALKLFKI